MASTLHFPLLFLVPDSQWENSLNAAPFELAAYSDEIARLFRAKESGGSESRRVSRLSCRQAHSRSTSMPKRSSKDNSCMFAWR